MMRERSGTGPEIREEPLDQLQEHAKVSIAYEVERVLDVVLHDDGPAGIDLVERLLTAPYIKDYDSIEGNHPTDWRRLFDLSNWGLLSAWLEGHRVGGAVIALMLEEQNNLTVLWDLRVSPQMRGRGIGSALFSSVERWARTRGCSQLKVETQNTNVTACRFYRRRGCELGAVHRFAYPNLPEEVQLLWYKDLSAGAGAAG
jgi:GNAT superfamily N-acetyltransferase